MDDKTLEKRLELLNEGYKRIPPRTDTSSIVKAIQDEQKPKKKKQPIHWSYVASFIGVLLIASVLSLQLIGYNKQSANQSDEPKEKTEEAFTSPELEEAIQHVKETFEAERNKAKESLGFSDELFEQTIMDQEAEALLSYIERLPKREYPTADEKVKMALDAKGDIRNYLQTPEEMMKNDQGELSAEEWMTSYLEKQTSITRIYEEKLYEFKGEWINMTSEEGSSLQYFNQDMYDQKSIFSGELQELIGGTIRNDVLFAYNESLNKVIVTMDGPAINAWVEENFPKLNDLYGRYFIVKSTPTVSSGEVIVSWSELGDRLIQYEKILRELPADAVLRNRVQKEYSELFQYFTRGSVDQSLYNQDGVLKSTIQNVFQQFLEQYPGYSTTSTISMYYDNLNATEMKMSGKNLPTAPIIPHSEGDIGKKEVEEIWNPTLSPSLLDTYERFSQTYDDSLLKDLSIFEVVSLHFYASDRHDYETEYELYGEEGLFVDKETFIQEAEMVTTDDSLTDNLTGFSEWKDESGAVSGVRLHFTDGTSTEFRMQQEDGIWKVSFLAIQ